MIQFPFDGGYLIKTSELWTQRLIYLCYNRQTLPLVHDQSKFRVFLMTKTSINFHLKFTCYEKLPYLHVHLYLYIQDKNELPVVVNWICCCTASNPQNVWGHNWIKISPWCTNIQYNSCIPQFQANSALQKHFSLCHRRWEGLRFGAWGSRCPFEPLAFVQGFRSADSAPS